MPDSLAHDTNARLDRIEALLQEGNRLRAEALATQKESFALQKSLMDETRANLAKAGTVNDGALEIQRRARGTVRAILGVVVLLVLYVSYLLFFRLNHS
jgi:hypothetical protein